eukprot:4028614-Amphidinium_carterae.1
MPALHQGLQYAAAPFVLLAVNRAVKERKAKVATKSVMYASTLSSNGVIIESYANARILAHRFCDLRLDEFLLSYAFMGKDILQALNKKCCSSMDTALKVTISLGTWCLVYCKDVSSERAVVTEMECNMKQKAYWVLVEEQRRLSVMDRSWAWRSRGSTPAQYGCTFTPALALTWRAAEIACDIF